MQYLPVHFWCFVAMWTIGVIPSFFLIKKNSKNDVILNITLLIIWPFFWVVISLIWMVVNFQKHVLPFLKYIWSYKRPA